MFGKKKITIPYSVKQCILCKKELKRKFKDGDFLFQETSHCKFCNGKMQIEKIYGETLEV